MLFSFPGVFAKKNSGKGEKQNYFNEKGALASFESPPT
jgi:hypothetical protein